MNTQLQTIITLPDPFYKNGTSVKEALLKRRSVREYKKEPLELKEISQLLWAAQGITFLQIPRNYFLASFAC